MSSVLPWKGNLTLRACAVHDEDQPFRVVASTLSADGRCTQCVAQDLRVPEEQVALFGADA